MHTIEERRIFMLKPTDIINSVGYSRRYFDRYSLERLAKSISVTGIIEPLSVRRNSSGEYELISGERRLRAAILAGLRRVPCVLHKIDAKTAAIYSVIENNQRMALNPFEEALAIEELIKKHRVPYRMASEMTGLGQDYIVNSLELLSLTQEIRDKIIFSNLDISFARLLLRIPEDIRENVINNVILKGLNLKQAEAYALRLQYNGEDRADILKITEEAENLKITENSEKTERMAPLRKFAIADTRLLYNSLTRITATLREAGMEVSLKKIENKRYTEYKIKIMKDNTDENQPEQLKIC